MKFDKMSHEERIKYLIVPIIQALQNAGGQLTRSELQEKIIAADDDIAEYASKVKKSKKTGNEYKEFNFKFNFAIKDLSFANVLEFEKRNPLITLTEKGININLKTFDIQHEVLDISDKCWEELSNQNKDKKTNTQKEEEIVNDDISIEDQYNNEFKIKLLDAISKMPPKKFETFSRMLLSKMGVQFTEQGIQVSSDGGIDGYGYHRDSSDFRTTRVVIQCKRYNNGTPVSEPAINQFLGAMSKFNADYGVFLTNSRFTKSAKEAALQGQPITLIDGNELVELVKKYKVYIKPITTYELLDFYDED